MLQYPYRESRDDVPRVKVAFVGRDFDRFVRACRRAASIVGDVGELACECRVVDGAYGSI
jgi:hypothetical protein